MEASEEPHTIDRFAKEAEAFTAVMRDLAPELRLDYSPKSLEILDEFISKRFEPPGSKFVPDSLIIGMGCYVGEVIIRNVGGHWNSSGKPEINDLGEIQVMFPIQKVAKRFSNGSVDSLSFYYTTILSHSSNK